MAERWIEEIVFTLTGQSQRLSYAHLKNLWCLRRTRTHDLCDADAVLSPTELWSHSDVSSSVYWPHMFTWKEWWMKEMFVKCGCPVCMRIISSILKVRFSVQTCHASLLENVCPWLFPAVCSKLGFEICSDPLTLEKWQTYRDEKLKVQNSQEVHKKRFIQNKKKSNLCFCASTFKHNEKRMGIFLSVAVYLLAVLLDIMKHNVSRNNHDECFKLINLC